MRASALLVAGAAAVASAQHRLRVSEATWEASLRRVDARLQRVPAEHRKRCGAVLRGEPRPGFSQAWQDWFLYRNFFAGQETGLYLDIGANDAIALSNTAFFDVCLGWKGVCFEPQAKYHAALRRQRSCELVPSCVLGKPQNATFSGEKYMFSAAPKPKPRVQTRLQCVGVLEELGRLQLGTRVDLLSIDIEARAARAARARARPPARAPAPRAPAPSPPGRRAPTAPAPRRWGPQGMESDVLRCLPFDRVDIRAVLIENNRHDLRHVDMFFHAHGYANVASLFQGPHARDARTTDLDNVYIKIPGGKLVFPSTDPPWSCSAADRRLNQFCAPSRQWLSGGPQARERSPWRACGED